jgi:methionyl-tRNA formyltransferase
MKLKIVFMGSPEFSVPVLQKLDSNFEVIGVVTQPDKPAGRGRSIVSPPIKTLATELGVRVIQPRKLKDPEAMEQLRAWQPELIVVAAFGQLLKSEVLDFPKYGCLNIHASILPRWRGAAPIQAAIMNGDKVTGITIMRMDIGLDTGPILTQRYLPILPTDTAGILSQRLAIMGAALIVETIPKYINGEIHPHAQDEKLSTHIGVLKKEDGELDFHQSAESLERKIRAFNPWPGAYSDWQNKHLIVHTAHVELFHNPIPGKNYVINGEPAWGTAQGLLVLDKVQPEGKRVMNGDDFLRGARNWVE